MTQEVKGRSFAFQEIISSASQQQSDTTKQQKSDLDEKIQYTATDSIINDVKAGIVYLYGNAKVVYGGFQLDAAFIKYDSKNELIFARGVKNERGRYSGRPIFKMDGEGTSIADSLTYNTKTGKGMIFGVFTEQEGGYFSGGRSKLQPENEVHIKNITFSTCNLPHPHFGIHISSGIATEKHIISGPLYMKFEDIPMPLFLPFAFFPKPNKKASGFILPTPLQDPTRGFSLNGFGYYMAFNDYMDMRVTGNVFTNGSFDVSAISNYTKRYKYNGGFNFTFSTTRNGLEGTPEYKPQKNFNISWQHSQNANARPGTTFSASVNAGTSSYYTTTAANSSYDINQIAQNTMSSSIAYGKVFANGLFNFTGALNHSQETQQKTITVTLPQISLNMSTINPFDSKNRLGEQKWYQKITMGYSLTGSNSVSTKEELLFDENSLKRFKNGFQHSIPFSLPFTLLNYFNFSANGNYSERWYFQSIEKRNIALATRDSVAVDTLSGFKRAGEYSIGMNMSTKIYGTKQFRNLGNIKAIRHVMTPSFNLSYKPDFAAENYGYYKPLRNYTNDVRPGFSVPLDGDNIVRDSQGNPVMYSIFEQGIYGGPSRGAQANMGFQIDNNVELKLKSKKDTTNGGEKKLSIIQGLTFSGSYNFIGKAKKLSPISFGGRSQFTDKLGLNFNGSLSPYVVGEVEHVYGTGANQTVSRTLEEIDRYVWKDGKLPRLTSIAFSFDYSLNPDAFKSRNKNLDQLNEQTKNANRSQQQIDELNAINRDPNAFVDFNVPWNLAFSYSFNYSNPLGNRSNVSNTVNFNGDVNLTPKWKVQFNSGYDFMSKTLSYTSFSIYRDLHCWDLSASWIPFGTYASYSINIKVKAAVLQDLKLSKRMNYYTKF